MTGTTTGRVDLGLDHTTLSTVPTTPRATAADAGDQFRAALALGATTVLAGVERVAPFVPGSVATPLAIRSAGAESGVAATSAGLSGDPLAAAGDSGNQALELLALQQRIGDEQQQFTTVSNVMKARHDTAKNVIGNVR